MSDKHKILVTGGAGFIASHIVDEYVRLGNEVVVIDNLSTGLLGNINPKVKFYKCDICAKEAGDIARLEKPNILNHHAAQIDVRQSMLSPLFDIDVNIKGFVNLVEAAKTSGIKKVIFSSTGGAIYGEQECYPADESHALNPINPYGINKLAVEKYLFYYKKQCGIDFVALRYSNVYGPRQGVNGEAGVIAVFAKRLLDHRAISIYGDGLQTRDYVYVDDVVKANVLALNDKMTGIYNVGSAVETTVNDLYVTMSELLSGKSSVMHVAAKHGEQRRSAILSKRLRQEFEWSPSTSLREGLQKTLAYYHRFKNNNI